MLTILNDGQSFGWDEEYEPRVNIVNTREEFDKAPHPKIILLDNHYKWYNYDRSGADLVVFWVTESLALERGQGFPIVKLHPNDRILSSSTGPNSNYSLLYWFYDMSNVYNGRYRSLLPKNEIYTNNLCCTLGHGRLTRIFTYLKLHESNLINRNVSFATSRFMKVTLPDSQNELIGQDEILEYVKNSSYNLEYRALELDWNKPKKFTEWWGQHRPGTQISSIIPTKAYHDSSLLLIHETILHNPEFFVTEKTIKGLLSGRPFIIIGSQGFLEKLRDLGFLTWSSVLNEYYDQEENVKTRIEMATASAKEFIDLNVTNYPNKLAMIQRISNHNRRVFFETNWHNKIENARNQLLLELGIC